MESLCNLLEGIIRNNRDSPIWIVGDMNLPNVNWNLNTVDGGTYPILLSKLYLRLTSRLWFYTNSKLPN